MPDVARSDVRYSDGTFDFSYGVDSGRVPTVQSNNVPNGLPRNALAWLTNGTVRGGGITQRFGWLKRKSIHAAALFQGSFQYKPTTGANPYTIASIAGNIYQISNDAPYDVINLSAKFDLFNPAGPKQVWMAQGEDFLVIQAGDINQPNPTLPLFWDGATLRRSNGIIPASAPSGSLNLTVQLGWVIPAPGAQVVVTLTGAYPGSVGDTITWGPYGTFTVNAITGNTITLVTVTTLFAGSTVTPGVYKVNVITKATTVLNVTTTNNFTWYNPPSEFEATLNAGTPYTGAVGDSVTWVGFGQFTVLGISADKLTVVFAINSTTITTDPIIAGNYTWIITASPLPPANVLSAVTTSGLTTFGPQFTTYNVGLSAPYAGPGTVGNVLYWTSSATDYGQFVILGVTGGGTNLILQGITNPGVKPSAAAGNYSFVEVVPNSTPEATLTNELPAAGPMVYYQGRMWYANGRIASAGDIVGGPSGTLPYKFRDAILKVTENPLAVGGDGFSVPSDAGNITAMAYTANLDATLGQGPLYIFTRLQVFALAVPVTRAAWIAAGGQNQPAVTVVQIKFGAVSDRCVVHANGDLFYQTLEPAIRSLFVSTRYFSQWGNVGISQNENRVLKFNNRALMPTATGILYDNRMLQGILPVDTPCGVGFQGIAPLDFDLISTLQQRLPPAWEGMLEGMDILQLLEADYGGLQRGFAIVHSRDDDSIQLWELTNFSTTDNVDSRVTWYFESPAFTFFKEFDLKELDGMELWLDTLLGTVELKVEYREDANPCWHLWQATQFCAAASTCEDVDNPVCYPTAPAYCAGYKFPIVLGKPKTDGCSVMTKRPTNRGYQFQVRVTIKGYCRVRALLLFALPIARAPYDGLTC